MLMNLIVWRHAEAQASHHPSYASDLSRPLTARGQQQAQIMATWLRARLTPDSLVLVSPALRTRQTASALTSDFVIDERLAPDTDTSALLAAADWPNGSINQAGQSRAYETIVIVGHQPTLGHTVSLLLSGNAQNWNVKQGAIWWLATRSHEVAQVDLHTMLTPDLL